MKVSFPVSPHQACALERKRVSCCFLMERVPRQRVRQEGCLVIWHQLLGSRCPLQLE
ncbi:hypothetical protein Hanom_Chr10g00922081 [Helianthus anomalus]